MKQKEQHRIVVFITCMTAFLFIVMSGSTVASEVYSWTDKDGVVHFGDRPPEGQESRTIVIPQAKSSGIDDPKPGPESTSPQNSSDTANVRGDEEAPTRSLADQMRDQMALDRKIKRENTEEMDRACAKHRQRLAQIEPSRRVFYTDEKGQTVRMDDQERVGLIEEDKEFIAENCK